jgi:hypothetical protein
MKFRHPFELLVPFNEVDHNINQTIFTLRPTEDQPDQLRLTVVVSTTEPDDDDDE